MCPTPETTTTGMPTMEPSHGVEALQQMRDDRRTADKCVAVVTADARVKAAAERLGVTYFLLKPVDPDEVLRLLFHHCTAPAATGTK